MLFEKTGTGKYLRKIDSVERLRKSDFEGEYWPYLHDEVAYAHDRNGYYVTTFDRIVEANICDLIPVFGNLYKWKEIEK